MFFNGLANGGKNKHAAAQMGALSLMEQICLSRCCAAGGRRMAFDPDGLRQQLLSASTPDQCWSRLCAHLAHEGLGTVLYTYAPLRLSLGDVSRSSILNFIGTFPAEYMAIYNDRGYANHDIGVDLCMPQPGTLAPFRPFHHWNGEYMYNLAHKQLEVETFTLKRFDAGITFALPGELGIFGGFSIACDGISVGEFWALIRGNHDHIVSCLEMFHRRYQQLIHQRDTSLIADWGLNRALESDWKCFKFGDIAFRLGDHQAQVAKMLFEAQARNQPWVSGKTLKHEVGFESQRLLDLFKSQKHWRKLILSDGRGKYRLNLNPDCV